jgi:hypothetical protein
MRPALTAIACGLLIAACGSSSNTGNPTKVAAKLHSDALAYSKCMRAHGVSKFPDPISSADGSQLSLGPSSGVNPQAPAFQAARASCHELLPFGGIPSAHASAQARADLLRMSACMRAHGVSGFPDPTTSAPSNPAAYSAVMAQNGAFLAIPKSIDVQSPAFKQAAKACAFSP